MRCLDAVQYGVGIGVLCVMVDGVIGDAAGGGYGAKCPFREMGALGDVHSAKWVGGWRSIPRGGGVIPRNGFAGKADYAEWVRWGRWIPRNGCVVGVDSAEWR